MRSTSSKNMFSLVRYAFLGLSLIVLVSACSRKPNLIPYGFGEIFDDPARASTAARVDYPLLYTMDPNKASITFRVSKYGERNWFWHGAFWDQPRWKSMKWYQISLIQQGDGDAVCLTKPTSPDTKDEVTEIECTFAKGNAGDYFDKPMNTLLDYYVDQEKEPGDMDQPTGTVPRMLYVIPKKY